MEQLDLFEDTEKLLTDVRTGEKVKVDGKLISSIYPLTVGRVRGTAVVCRDGDKYLDYWVREASEEVRGLFGITRPPS